jgi:hypothetical protein
MRVQEVYQVSRQTKKSSYGKDDWENKSIEEVAVCSSRVIRRTVCSACFLLTDWARFQSVSLDLSEIWR